MHSRKCYLLAGAAVPVLYFGNLLVSALFYPGYSHITQYASELGGPDATYPAIFNTGIILTGVAGMMAGVGFYCALKQMTGRVLLPFLLALCVVLFGLSLVMGGLFPIPDERHGGFGLGLVIHLAPWLLALGLWKHKTLRGLVLFLVVNGVIFLALFAIMMGVGELVTRANVGIWQRLYALAMLPWIGVASVVLACHLDSPNVQRIPSALRSAL